MPHQPPVEPGDLLDARFEVLRVLGEGGMGIALLARELTTSREVVIKCLRGTKRLTAEHLSRFMREAQLLSRARPPNVVAVFAQGMSYMCLTAARVEVIVSAWAAWATETASPSAAAPTTLALGARLVDA